MPSKIEDHFQAAAEFQRRFAELNGSNLAIQGPSETGGLDFMAIFDQVASARAALYSGERSAEIAQLRKDLEALGVEPPMAEQSGNMADLVNLTMLQEGIYKLSLLRATVLPELSIAELAGDAHLPAMSLETPQGFAMADLLENLRSRAFVLQVGDRHFQVEGEDLRGLLRNLTVAVVEEINNPKRLSLHKQIWNPARKFNPRRITNLKISGLEWDVLSSRSQVKVLCSNLEEVLAAHPEDRPVRRTLRLPRHPTFPAPWRLLLLRPDGELWEECLGATPEAAWTAYVDRTLEIVGGWVHQEGLASREEMLACFGKRDADGTIVLEAEINRGHEERFRIEQDHKDLPVVGRLENATDATREAAKAREIWFQRFAEVVSPGLPAAVGALRFDLDTRPPKSPFRTFIAALEMGCEAERPNCPECGGPCDRVVHMDLRHHPQRLSLPGTSLLLFTCETDNWAPEQWQVRWLKKGEAASVIQPLLEGAEVVLAGPAFRDLDYEDAKVDRDAFNRESERWKAFDYSWEKKYFMFATPGTKVGGAPSWIQGDGTPTDSRGKPMQFVGQVGCYDLIPIGDSGEAYIYHSPKTGETTVITQCF